jgi:hypothetical protein
MFLNWEIKRTAERVRIKRKEGRTAYLLVYLPACLYVCLLACLAGCLTA